MQTRLPFSEFEAHLLIETARGLWPSVRGRSSRTELWPALFAVLWQTQRRLGEVLSIRRRDLGFAGLAYRAGHTHELAPQVWTPAWLWAELFQLAERRDLGPADLLFPVSKQAADKALKRIAASAGVAGPVRIELFRGRGQA